MKDKIQYVKLVRHPPFFFATLHNVFQLMYTTPSVVCIG